MKQDPKSVTLKSAYKSASKLKSFTLIEILVVVAIIGILASLLLPSLSKARASAHRSVCVNNLKNISQALLMYPDDNDDYFSSGDGDHTGGPTQTYTWDDFLALGNYDGRSIDHDAANGNITDVADGSKIYYCPSSKIDYTRADGAPIRNYAVNMTLMWRTNRQMNAQGGRVSGPAISNPGYQKGSVTVNAVSSPSRTVMIFELISNIPQGHRANSNHYYLDNIARHSWHNKTYFSVMGFADGSVRHTGMLGTSNYVTGGEDMWDLD